VSSLNTLSTHDDSTGRIEEAEVRSFSLSDASVILEIKNPKKISMEIFIRHEEIGLFILKKF
jgi:hypothetical protein